MNKRHLKRAYQALPKAFIMYVLLGGALLTALSYTVTTQYQAYDCTGGGGTRQASGLPLPNATQQRHGFPVHYWSQGRDTACGQDQTSDKHFNMSGLVIDYLLWTAVVKVLVGGTILLRENYTKAKA